jgi:uncharacterized protein VirK/YbjX
MPDRTLEERAAFLCRTPAEVAQLDAFADRIHRERALAPDLADRYDAACASVSELHDETVRQRRRIDALTDELDAAREALAAATWPTRAAQRLENDARPTTERSTT